jgi:hypothetical protein
MQGLVVGPTNPDVARGDKGRLPQRYVLYNGSDKMIVADEYLARVVLMESCLALTTKQ